MADQRRWFKLWCSAPADDDLLALPPELRWAWAVLGCYTKEHGTRGRVKVTASNVVLAAQMAVPVSALQRTIAMLPHLQIESGNPVYGEFTVTWKNWVKYQEDSTQAERQQRSRSKKRREENKKIPPKPPLTVDEIVSEFGGLEAYRHLDVRQAALRLVNWCTANGFRPSRRRVVNWLNQDAQRARAATPAPVTRHPGVDLR